MEYLMIQARSMNLAFLDRTIFNNLSFIINQYDKIGLVGRNGSGKTTLLKAIIDPSILDSGSVTIQNKKTIAYVPQEMVLESSLSILNEALTADPVLYALAQEFEQIEALLEKPEHSNDAALVERYGVLQSELQERNYETFKAQAKKMLMGLGFSIAQLDQPTANLSVGWKMRVVLTKLLLKNADFYLFDEPTNHLDLTAKEWFLDFLKKSDFGFIIISHEQYFLDELSEKILELDRGKAAWYNGNYSEYVVRKERDLEILTAAYIQQRKDIKQKEEMISRFSAGTRSRQAQSMKKGLDKIERIEIPQSQRNVKLTFPPIQQAGKEVIAVSNVSHAFGEKVLFNNVSFAVQRGQKVALVAPNGVGKTTLFNLIAGVLPLEHGTVTFGYNVTHALFTQDQNQVLKGNLSIFENIEKLCPEVSERDIRSFLGSFLFSGEEAYKKVSVLSGGEKNRVGMVSVLLKKANLLLLDEPTNHLDIPSKEVLLKALKEFSGTILFVSHSRDFINDLATDIVELTPEGAYTYHGNFDAYLHQRPVPKTDGADSADTKNNKHSKNSSGSSNSSSAQPLSAGDLAKKMQKHEALIAKLEEQISSLGELLSDYDYGTPEFDSTMVKVEKLQKELKLAEKEWELLQGKPV